MFQKYRKVLFLQWQSAHVRHGLLLLIVFVVLSGLPYSRPSDQRGYRLTDSPLPTPTSQAVLTQKDPYTRPAAANSAVLTQRGDSTRLGWDQHETVLNTSTVNVSRFGKRIAYSVDGKIYAQPLFVPNLLIRSIDYNVVIVATEHDSVYAFDADARTPEPPLWHTSFLHDGTTTISSMHDVHCPSISPEFGITGTPVIDPVTRTLYIVAATHEGTELVYRLHSLDITTGSEKVLPMRIQASMPGTGDTAARNVIFNAYQEQMHMGLLLLNGVVYTAFASYCDKYPFHGWILGYRASDLQQVVVYTSTPKGWGGGIWESASGLTADTDGNIYVMSGNGSFDLDTGGLDASNSLMKLRPQNGHLKIVDSFTPFNQKCTLAHDLDLGSGTPLLLPGQNEIIAIGKEGRIYVLNRSNLGGYQVVPDPCNKQQLPRTDIDHVIQELPPYTLPGEFWGAEGYYAAPTGEYIYTAGSEDHLKAWKIVNGKLVPSPVSQAPETLNYPGAIPVVSSNERVPGTAIVWLVDQENVAVLRAYAATDLTHELYNSRQNTSRDGLQGYDNFIVPTIANGEVFVGTAGSLAIFGQLD
ncbi:MAG TPA: hypothetical protein VFB12_31460 [Ktedonobacteraceae bacterium]|nr:hypothetical protein [Ktedonobacteraceae bacterium]